MPQVLNGNDNRTKFVYMHVELVAHTLQTQTHTLAQLACLFRDVENVPFLLHFPFIVCSMY